MTLLEEVVTLLHDQMCQCGDRCTGWIEDKWALQEFLLERYGSESALDYTSEEEENGTT